MKCDCGGNIDHNISRTIFTLCQGEMTLNPCDQCGLLHWAINGQPLFQRELGVYVYMMPDGRTVDENGNLVNLTNKWCSDLDCQSAYFN